MRHVTLTAAAIVAAFAALRANAQAPAAPGSGAPTPLYAPSYAAPNYPSSAPAAAAPTYAPAPALASPPGPIPGTRAGHEPGVGLSEPRSNAASNIDRRDTRSDIAPTLPSPTVGDGAGPAGYLRAARAALATGRTGEAQQALEMAQTRLLDRSVAYGAVNTPSGNPAVAQIGEALRALAAGDRPRAMQLIDATLPQVAAEDVPQR